MEQWKVISSIDGYEVSSTGRARNKANGRILKQRKNHGGYKAVSINYQSFSVHRLVALAFIANPRDCPTVDDKDRVRDNNNLGNLQWASHQEQAVNRDNQEIHNARGVWQCDKDTSLPINFYSTIAEALLALGKDTAVNYLAKTAKANNCAYGFKWMYADVVQDLPDEVWKEYRKSKLNIGCFVSNFGRVRTGTRLLKIHTDNHGYLLTSESQAVHILVARHFVANPHGFKIVNHIDGNKQNPSALNLEWTTPSGNAVHAIENGLRSNVTEVAHIDEHGVIITTFKSCSHAGRALKVGSQSVNKCCKGTIRTCGKSKLRFAYYDSIAKVVIPAVRVAPQPARIPKPRKVNVFDLKENLLACHDTIMACCRAHSVNPKTVSAHCEGKVNHPHGSLRFRYKLEVPL